VIDVEEEEEETVSKKPRSTPKFAEGLWAADPLQVLNSTFKSLKIDMAGEVASIIGEFWLFLGALPVQSFNWSFSYPMVFPTTFIHSLQFTLDHEARLSTWTSMDKVQPILISHCEVDVSSQGRGPGMAPFIYKHAFPTYLAPSTEEKPLIGIDVKGDRAPLIAIGKKSQYGISANSEVLCYDPYYDLELGLMNEASKPERDLDTKQRRANYEYWESEFFRSLVRESDDWIFAKGSVNPKEIDVFFRDDARGWSVVSGLKTRPRGSYDANRDEADAVILTDDGHYYSFSEHVIDHRYTLDAVYGSAMADELWFHFKSDGADDDKTAQRLLLVRPHNPDYCGRACRGDDGDLCALPVRAMPKSDYDTDAIHHGWTVLESEDVWLEFTVLRPLGSGLGHATTTVELSAIPRRSLRHTTSDWAEPMHHERVWVPLRSSVESVVEASK